MREFNSFFTCCIAVFIFSAQVSTASNMQVVDIAKSGMRFLVFFFFFTDFERGGSVAGSIECHICPNSFSRSESYRISISTVKVSTTRLFYCQRENCPKKLNVGLIPGAGPILLKEPTEK